MSYQQEKFTAIADNIRTCLGTDEKIKPYDFAAKVIDVYDAGRQSLMPSLDDANETISEQRKTIEEQTDTIQKQESEILRQRNTIKSQALNIDRLTNNVIEYRIQLENTAQAITDTGVQDATIDNTAEKIPQVFEAGKKSEYDEFWDTFQDYGNRTRYINAFSWNWWTDELYNPKYPLLCTSANAIENTFYYNTSITDTKVPIIVQAPNESATQNMLATFYRCHKLKTIPLLSLEGVGNFRNTFTECYELETLNLQGIVEVDGFDLHWSTKLSKDSITSIINTLSNTTNGLTLTLSQTAVDTSFETSEGLADGSTSSEWTTLIATKSNWTISLV